MTKFDAFRERVTDYLCRHPVFWGLTIPLASAALCVGVEAACRSLAGA